MLEDKELVLKQSHLQVETDLNAFQEIMDWFEQFSNGLVQKQLALQCQLILAESFTVVVRSACESCLATTPIELELKLFADYLEIRILEQGKRFCSLARLISHEAATEGPRVIRFVPRLIDELCYICLPDRGNCLVMRKRLIKDT